MPLKWQCINIECDYKEYGNNDDKCPKCSRSFYKVSDEESKKIIEMKDRYKADPDYLKKGRGYNTAGAIILAYIVTGIFGSFLIFIPSEFLTEFIAIFIIISGGFIATYLSRSNKPIIGLYYGLLWNTGYLIIALISKNKLNFYSVLILVLIPILGFIGGYVGRILKLHFRGEKN